MRFEIVRRIVEGQQFRAECFLLDPTLVTALIVPP
jgi:hypothetical protein